MSALQCQRFLSKTAPPRGGVRIDGEDWVQSDVEDGAWAAVVGDTLGVATMHREGRVDETHGTAVRKFKQQKLDFCVRIIA